jgi:CDP-diacylglycerol--glycerol-3-phosphate 3-phosphatidyltransferase
MEGTASATRPDFWWVPNWVTPNHLTILRALLVVPVILIAQPHPWTAVLILIASSACDYYDGKLARARGQNSKLGDVLDPIADKIFVLGTMWWACRAGIHPCFLYLITGIEASLLLLRPIELLLKVKASANLWGKIKTWVESFALAFVLTQTPFFLRLAPFVFAAATGFGVASLCCHLRDTYRSFKR